MNGVPRAGAGRGDLVRALAARGAVGLESVAPLLGYFEPRREKARERPVGEPAEAPPRREAEAAEPEGVELAPVPFWRLESLEALEETEGEGEAGAGGVLSLAELTPVGEPPEAAPIVPWARLWPALHGTLRSAVPSREVDVGALVERWGRGELVERLPRKSAFAWSRRVTVLVDRSRRLIPFWSDQDELCRRLRRLLGRAGVRVVRGLAGPQGPWDGARRPYRPRSAAPGSTVLALSDLGFYAGAPARAGWTRLGRSLGRRGVRIRALLPCPAARWDRAAAALWRAVDWSAPLRTRLGPRPDPEAVRARCERLLGLVSPALRVEPGLLRAIRRLLPAVAADAGTEADVWSHPDVDGSSSVALSIAASLDEWRAGFRREAPALRAAAIRELSRWHGVLPREIWHQEALALATGGGGEDGALPPSDAVAARRFTLRFSRTLKAPEATDSRQGAAMAGYLLRVGPWLPPEVWGDAQLRRPLARAWGVASRDRPDLPLPPGLTPDLLEEEVPRTPREWSVWQVGSELHFRPAGDPLEAPAGSLLVNLLAAFPEIDVATDHASWQARCRLSESPEPCPLPQSSIIVLTTDRRRAELRRYVRPTWASALGRDRRGLWAEVDSILRVRWVLVTEFEISDPDTDLDSAPLTGANGVWIVESRPDWASDAGWDEHGFWLEVAIEDVAFRLRWMPPGRFWMGSPESEAGRWEDESPRHEVTLTRGFWLGETPCTQALWQVVTGESPSRFQSPDRPVDRVSWKDCRAFCDKLNERIPELEVRLPTEAEWEYACRAATETSTYAGEMEILGERNAPVVDEVAWYGGNSGVGFELENGYDSSGWAEKQYPHERAGTHPVARKKPNAWGLYDMLGNVWEWCEDSTDLEPYDRAQSVEDPVSRKGSERVSRGGSWASLARIVRAAARLAHSPGLRYDSLGFRLARGQKKSKPGTGASKAKVE